MNAQSKLITALVGVLLVGCAFSAQSAKAQGATKAPAKKQTAVRPAEEAGEEAEVKLARKDVPPAVLTAFAKAFPKAVTKGYTKETENGKTIYEVESMEGKTHRDVTYAEDGKLLMVEESVEMKDVPAAVHQALEKKFPNCKVDLAEKVMEGASVSYELHVTTAQGKKEEVKFDASGKEVKG